MLKVLLLFIAVSYLSTAQTLPEGINRRIGNELDSTEAEYFGLFSRIQDFKSSTISENKGELTFQISRIAADDTIIVITQKTSEVINTYITHFEEMFDSPEIQGKIDWNAISAFARPNKPIQNTSKIDIELINNASFAKYLLMYNDSLIIFWNASSKIDFDDISENVEVLSFSEIEHLNGWPVYGRQDLYINMLNTLKGEELFVKIPPEVRKVMQVKIEAKQLELKKSPTTDKDSEKESFLQTYLKKFTVSVAFKQRFISSQNYLYMDRFFYGPNDNGGTSLKGSSTSKIELNYKKYRWYGEILYNLIPYFSIGVSYDYLPELAKIERGSEHDFKGSVASFITVVHPLPRNPMVSILEPEIGLSIGYASYILQYQSKYQYRNSEHYFKPLAPYQIPSTLNNTWEASAYAGIRLFPFKNISFNTGILYRTSGDMKVEEWVYAPYPMFPYLKRRESKIKLSHYEMFFMSSFHF